MGRRWLIGAGACVVLAAGLVATGVRAQVCVAREGLVRVLAERYGEHESGRGLTASGQLVELFRNPRTESWTLVLSDQSGRSCVLFAGGAWQGTVLPGSPT